METILVIALFAYSIYWCLNYAEITKPIRNWVNSPSLGHATVGQPAFKASRHPFLLSLMRCPYCLCWHISLITAFVLSNGFYSVLIAFASAILCLFLDLIKNILFKKSVM